MSLPHLVEARIQRLTNVCIQVARHPLSWAALLGSCAAVTAVAVAIPQEFLPPVASVSQALSQESPDVLALGEVPFTYSTTVQSQDTIAAALARMSINDDEALRFIIGTREAQSIARNLRPGTQLTASTDRLGRLVSFTMPSPDATTSLVLHRTDSGFKLQSVPLAFESGLRTASGVIRSSLFAATDAIGLPDEIAVGLADIFGNKVDFRRDLRKGDRFTVHYETVTLEGRLVRGGRILAAELINDGQRLTAVWFGQGSTRGEYYSEDGRSLREGFLRSPLEFSRVTSGFSMRMHPILRQWRAHRGVDFGAPTGTRIRASGGGSVGFVGVQNGYGNVVILNHANGISTAYAHLSRFAAGLRVGQRIEQGEMIGYVGQTGWATAPHLHYEFRVNGNPKDPMTVALPTAPALTGDRLAAFRQHAAPLLAQLKASPAVAAFLTD